MSQLKHERWSQRMLSVTLVDRGALQLKSFLRCVLFMNFTISLLLLHDQTQTRVIHLFDTITIAAFQNISQY